MHLGPRRVEGIFVKVVGSVLGIPHLPIRFEFSDLRFKKFGIAGTFGQCHATVRSTVTTKMTHIIAVEFRSTGRGECTRVGRGCRKVKNEILYALKAN